MKWTIFRRKLLEILLPEIVHKTKESKVLPNINTHSNFHQFILLDFPVENPIVNNVITYQFLKCQTFH